jgi:DNA modification methylase
MNFDILDQIGNLKNPPRSQTSNFTHSIHPYPAKYIPQIPHKIISTFTNERHTILDPFCGSGTSLLEAKLLGRDSIGTDLNPIGVLISRVKTYTLTQADLEFLTKFKCRLKKAYNNPADSSFWMPDIPNIQHWFSLPAIEGLRRIVHQIRMVENVAQKRILNLALSNIIVGVSNQESETRFSAKNKNDINVDRILDVFLKKLDDIVKRLLLTSSLEKFNNSKVDVFLQNTLLIENTLSSNSIDLIVTSPPYLNSFDYYLYHKFRIFWISYPENIEDVIPVKVIQKEEIGSRYRYSGAKSNGVESFNSEMETCFKAFNKILKPSKLLFLVVGDSIVKGDFMKMDSYYSSLLSNCGFKLLSKVSYLMSDATRSFISMNKANKYSHLKESHVLAFESLNLDKNESQRERINLGQSDQLNSNSIDVVELPGSIENGSSFYINSNSVTELTHGLIKYPAKYIPQIPAWAIKQYSKKGDVVLDPFNGSGTTSVESLILGRSYIGIDINPFGILASEVKTQYIAKNEIQTEIERLKLLIAEKKLSNSYEKLDFNLKEFWFDQKALNDIFLLKSAIGEIPNIQVRNLMLLSLSSIIKKVSYQDEGQLKVKRDAKKVLNGVPNAIDLFMKRLFKDAAIIERLEPFKVPGTKRTHIVGSAFDLSNVIGDEETIDLIVTSPPYINAMNYPMYHRYELLLLGLITPEDYLNHQEQYIGTERVYVRDYKSFHRLLPEASRVKDLNSRLLQIFQLEPKRYYIAKKYFEDMFKFLQAAYRVLKKGKKLVIVCGTNTIKGVPINTSTELSNLAQEVGFSEVLNFSYEIRKHRFKLTRHQTAGKINNDIIVVLEK